MGHLRRGRGRRGQLNVGFTYLAHTNDAKDNLRPLIIRGYWLADSVKAHFSPGNMQS